MSFFHEAESWVLISFLLFVALLVYLKVPKIVGRLLDEHSFKVKHELDEARKLREDAEALLAEYKQKRVDAEKQASEIVASAKADAAQFAADASAKLTETMDRRTKQAEQKIARAEAAATAEVRTRATELATAAAAHLLGDAATGKKGASLIADSIAAVKSRFN
jgi:F-type H+-transporting ATPase subunit b